MNCQRIFLLATFTISNLIHADGEKLAKADATSINKFVRMFDGFIAKTFKKESLEITLWRDGKKQKTKILLENRQKLIDQFAEKRQEKLDNVSLMLDLCLGKTRELNNVSEEFYGECDFSSLIKLTGTLTPRGELTKKATDFIRNIATNEKAEQIRIESRHLHLENRCLRAEINPPLTYIHLGTDFYAEDDVFNAKVEQLVNAEIERKAEMEARIIKQQEANKQAEIDAALKAQQAEADANARVKAIEEQETTEPEKQTTEPVTTEPKQQAASVAKEPINEPVQKPVNGKHTVRITAKFAINVSDRVSDNAVRDHFISQLPEKLKSAIEVVVAES